MDPALANTPGVPELTGLEILTEFLTTIVYTCTVQHSAVNFGQFDYYAFVPNRPLLLTRPMPDDKSLVTLPYIMNALPNEGQTSAFFLSFFSFLSFSHFFFRSSFLHTPPPQFAGDAVAVSRVLSLSTTEQTDPLTNKTIGFTLASFPSSIYVEQYTILTSRLAALHKEIDVRNAKLEVPYHYLSPNEIASSIAI